MASLDDTTKREIDLLTPNEVSRGTSYAFEHELLWYGVEAVAHHHLMRQARDVAHGKTTFPAFCRKYQLISGKWKSGAPRFLAVPLKTIEHDGVYVPKQAYWDDAGTNHERDIRLFSGDYRNRFYQDNTKNAKKDITLIELFEKRKFDKASLKDPRFIADGIRFSRDLWRRAVRGFEEYQRGDERIDIAVQPTHVTRLGGKLMRYYSALIEGR